MTWVEVAQRQAGLVSLGQLDAEGVSRAQTRWLVTNGSLEVVQRGVYRLCGTGSGWMSSLWSALLCAGPSGFACRRAAAALWQLDGVESGYVEVGVPRPHHPRLAGAVRYSIDPSDITLAAGVPVTSVRRTILDLGCVAPDGVVERSLESALRRRLTCLEDLITISSVRAPGAAVLRRVLKSRPSGAGPTESDAETRFLLIARAMGLPDPKRQFVVSSRGRSFRLDFAWPEVWLAAEIDGASVHGPGKLTADLRRQNQIVLNGWTILRFSWATIVYSEAEVRRDLAAAWRACSFRQLGPVSR